MDSSHSKPAELSRSTPLDLEAFPKEFLTGPEFHDFSLYGFHPDLPLDLDFDTLALGTSHPPPSSAPLAPPLPHTHPTHNPYGPSSANTTTFVPVSSPTHAFPPVSPTTHTFSAQSTPGFHTSRYETSDNNTIRPPPILGIRHRNFSRGSDTVDVTERAGDGLRAFTKSPLSSANSSSSTRYDPIACTRPRIKLLRATLKEDDQSDDERDAMDRPVSFLTSPVGNTQTHEEMRQQCRAEMRQERIENERQRRNELRDGYAKLKSALPFGNGRNSKAALLDRAVDHILQIEMEKRDLQRELDSSKREIAKLREINEMRSLVPQ